MKYFGIKIILQLYLLFLLCINNCKSYPKRNLDGGDDEDKSADTFDELNFEPLKIYLDFDNLEGTFPFDESYKDIFETALNQAKEVLENSVTIKLNFERTILKPYMNSFGIIYFNESLYDGTVAIDEYNFIVLFKFGTLSNVENLAISEIISTDKFDTPKIGIITINENFPVSKMTIKFLKTLMIHQFIHLLGFIYDDTINNNIIEEESEEDADSYNYYINSENVINYAKKYFNCDSINKIYLEKDEDDMIHWPSRFFLGEIMTKFNYPEEQVISEFTLSFFDDLIYLNVEKRYTGGLMRFGKNNGCNFLDKKCLNNGVKFENDFYYPTNMESSFKEPSCSSGRLSKTFHKLHNYDSIPSNYQYFSENPTLGGVLSVNYCPISEYDIYSEENIYYGRCSEEGTDIDINKGEIISSKSFCVLSSLYKETNDNTENEENFNSFCYEMACSEKSLTIKIGDENIVCPRGGGKIEVKNYKGYLLCPDYNLICTGSKICNDIYSCINEESQEKTATFTYEDNYNYQTTQDLSVYMSQTTRKDGYELSSDGICPVNCAQCNIKNQVSICIKCPSHLFLENNQCISKIENCLEYDENNCISCKDGYYLTKENNEVKCSLLTSEEIKLYYKSDNSIYYVKCHEQYENCKECNNIECTTCLDNYVFIGNDKSKCLDMRNQKYYKDPNDNIYKLCNEGSKAFTNCETCELINNNLNCLKCKTNYALLYNEESTCKEISQLDSDITVFPDESKEKYYKCSNSLFHSIKNCQTCQNKTTCLSCQIGYTLYNNGELCLSSQDLESHYMENGKMKLCSESIKGCNKCVSNAECTECSSNYEVNEDNKCIHDSLISIKYYYNSTLGKYMSCSNLENCEECTSEKDCTRCINGFNINKGKCEKIETNQEMKDKDHDKLMSLAVTGVVLGSVAIACIILIVALFLWNKYFKKTNGERIGNNIENNNENDNNLEDIKKNEKDTIYVNTEEIVVKSNKRSISNTNKNE